jgi:hypothetical protein
MRRPKNNPIDALRRVNPASAEEIRARMSDEEHLAARARAIEAGEEGGDLLSESLDLRPDGFRSRRVRRGTRFAIGGAVATAAVVAAILAVGGSSVGPGGERAFAAEAVEVAEANPRVLVGAPGWSVTRADEFERDHGSMRFTDGEHALRLDWTELPSEYSAFDFARSSQLPEFDQWYRIPIACPTLQDLEREAGGSGDCKVFERRTEISVLGRTAVLEEGRTVSPARESNGFTVYLPTGRRALLTVHASSISRVQFFEVLDSLYTAEVETWLAALPPRIVKPIERPAVVDEMLRDVPIPPGVDVKELKGEPSAAGRYHLGAAVTGAVACGWLDQWARAIEGGDAAAADEAVEAMSTSRDWAILQKMDEQGGWSRTIWEYAEKMRQDDRNALLGVAGTETLPDGRVYELSPSYATGIGCDSERRVLRDERAEVPPPSYPKPIPVDSPN